MDYLELIDAVGLTAPEEGRKYDILETILIDLADLRRTGIGVAETLAENAPKGATHIDFMKTGSQPTYEVDYDNVAGFVVPINSVIFQYLAER